MSASEGRDPSQPQKRASVSVSYSDSYSAGENQDELHKVESSYGFGMSHPDDDEEEPGDLHHHMTEEDKGHEHNVKAHHEGWNSLAEKHRGRCTDCTCLVSLFFVCVYTRKSKITSCFAHSFAFRLNPFSRAPFIYMYRLYMYIYIHTYVPQYRNE